MLPITTTDDLLRELIAEVRGLRADLRVPRLESSLSRADQHSLSKLLPAITGALGSDLFLVRDLFESEKPALRLVLRSWNARQVGRLLRRAERHVISGHAVQRDGEELGAVLWRVVQSL